MGIRVGVWLIALGLVVACVLVIALSPRHKSSPTAQIASTSENALARQPSIAPKVNSWRPTRPLVAPKLEESGARLEGRWSAEDAATLACSLANQSAKELYDCEPFGQGPPARLVDGCWVWSDSRGRGRADVEATVHFALDGSVQNVDVLLLDSTQELW
jgi:hypothetical protein